MIFVKIVLTFKRYEIAADNDHNFSRKERNFIFPLFEGGGTAQLSSMASSQRLKVGTAASK